MNNQEALDYLETCGQQLAWQKLDDTSIMKVNLAAKQLRSAIKQYEKFEEHQAEILCAVTHNFNACDSCKKCGKTFAEARANLAKVFLEEE